MANFAQIDQMNIVRDVIVISNLDCGDLPFPESEPVGQAFIASIGIEGVWLQTSYNGNFRGLYAGLGYVFDALIGEYGVFVEPTPQPIA
jgi:hypothetical protein